MSMIKRGNCDNPNPTVISFSCTCPSCGYSEQANGSRVSVCPQCNNAMNIASSSAERSLPLDPTTDDCPDGVCKIKKAE